MSEYGLVKSFDIDHGELDGIPAPQCFVMGYELALIDEALKRPERIWRPVHAANFGRVEKSCRDANRDFSLTYMHDDPSEGWMWLEVAPA